MENIVMDINDDSNIATVVKSEPFVRIARKLLHYLLYL